MMVTTRATSRNTARDHCVCNKKHAQGFGAGTPALPWVLFAIRGHAGFNERCSYQLVCSCELANC